MGYWGQRKGGEGREQNLKLFESPVQSLAASYVGQQRNNQSTIVQLYTGYFFFLRHIMEYGSTPYIGMAWEKNGHPISCVQNHVVISLVNP